MIYHFGNTGAIFDFYQAYSEETVWEPSFPDEKYLWAGEITYAAKQFTLKKTDTGAFKKDGKYSLFSDDDLPLTFIRYDCTEEELLPLLPWDEEDHLKEGFEPGQLLEFGLSVAEENSKKISGQPLRTSGPISSEGPPKCPPFQQTPERASPPEWAPTGHLAAEKRHDSAGATRNTITTANRAFLIAPFPCPFRPAGVSINSVYGVPVPGQQEQAADCPKTP